MTKQYVILPLPELPGTRRYRFEFELVVPPQPANDWDRVNDLATQVSYLATRYAESVLKIPGIAEIPTKPISHPDCERMVDVYVWQMYEN